MAKLYFVSTAVVFLTASAAFAGPAVRDFKQSSVTSASQDQRPREMAPMPNMAPNAAFGAALETAMATPGAHNVPDPSGKFVVRVADVGGERVVTLVSLATNESRQWKFAPSAGAGDATIAEIMKETGLSSGTGIAGAGTPSDHGK